MNALTYSAIGLAVGIGASITTAIVKKTRQVARERRRDQLRSVARSNGLSLLEGEIPQHLHDRVQRHGGKTHKIGVDDVLLGRDDEGSYYFARRTGSQSEVHLLLFDANKDTRIDGLALAPKRRNDTRSRAKRWFNAVLSRPVVNPLSMELNWSCRPADLLQEGLLERVSLSLRAVAAASTADPHASMGIQIDGRRIIISSEHRLGIKEFAHFMREALHLRRHVLAVVLDVRHLGSTGSRAIAPITEAIAEVANGGSVRSQRRERLLLKQSSPWSMPMDVPEELRNSGHSRAVPIVEEEVEVLSGYGNL